MWRLSPATPQPLSVIATTLTSAVLQECGGPLAHDGLGSFPFTPAVVATAAGTCVLFYKIRNQSKKLNFKIVLEHVNLYVYVFVRSCLPKYI